MTANLAREVATRTKDLPPLPVVTQRLLAALADQEGSAEDVTRILESDPVLTGKVLKLVNSPFYGMSRNVTTPSRAVVILGFSAVRSLALGLGVAGSIQKAAGELDLQAFWRHAIVTATTARIIAQKSRGIDPEEAFVAALLHDIGSLPLELAAPGRSAAVRADATDLVAAERAEFGVSHTDVGSEVANEWQLPPTLVEAIRSHHDRDVLDSEESPLTALVALADIVAQALEVSDEPPVAADRVFTLASQVGFAMRETGGVLHRMELAVAETKVFLTIAGADTPEPPTLGSREPQSRCVCVAADPDRAGWILGLLAHYGQVPLGLQPFFDGEKEASEVVTVVIDADSATPEQCQKLPHVLAGFSGRLCVFGEPGPELAGTLPEPHTVLNAGFGPTALTPGLAAAVRRV